MLHRIKNIRKTAKKSPPVIVITNATGVLGNKQPTIQETWQLPGDQADLAQIAMQATSHGSHDPLDAALVAFTKGKGVHPPSHPPMRHLPFSHTIGMSGSLWHNGAEYNLAAKGAPEHILERCDLTEGEREHITLQLHKFAQKGYRVAALAYRPLTRPITSFDDLTKKDKLHFAGLLALANIIQPAARHAIITAVSAGTAVYIITGDHLETAYRLGHELGVVRLRGQVLDARRLEVMSDEELEELLGEARIFARATPEHKRRIVEILKKHRTIATPSNLEELQNRAGQRAVTH